MTALPVRRGMAAMAAAALATTLLSVPLTAPASASASTGTWLVSVEPGALGGVVADLREAGVTVTRELAGVGMAVVEAPAAALRSLTTDPRVTGVTPDSDVQMHSSTYDARGDVNSAYNVGQVVGARGLWSRSNKLQWTGAGVDVALLDTGVTPVTGLNAPGKVVHGPDLSFDSQSASTRHLDGFGHGTHMAGLIAGKDADANLLDPGSSGPFIGMAPDARVVSVKVADAWGNADVSQIVAGIDWVVQNRKSHGLNVRVLNLSLGTPSAQSSLLDPLSFAVEQAWHKGIVVVASVGNDGTGTGQLLNPARNPYVIAVGANDSKGSTSTDDDVIPDFSTRGDGTRNPDLVAPGQSLQSLRVPGSYIDEQNPTARLGERFLRGSGTSQAAAVVSGGIALLLQQRPSLTPEDVKYLVTSGARALPSADKQAQGKGMLDLRKPAATTKLSYAEQGFDKAKGTGSLDAARGGFRIENELGIVLDGERDIMMQAFDATAQAAKSSMDATWDGGSWNKSPWIGTGWSEQGWTGVAWTGTDLAGRTWAGRTWASAGWR